MDLKKEKEATDKINEVLTAIRNGLVVKRDTLQKRLDFMLTLDVADFTTEQTKRNFENDIIFVETERTLLLNELAQQVHTTEGQIQGQDEMIAQNTGAYDEAAELELAAEAKLHKLIDENTELKSRLDELNTDGEEE